MINIHFTTEDAEDTEDYLMNIQFYFLYVLRVLCCETK